MKAQSKIKTENARNRRHQHDRDRTLRVSRTPSL